LTSGSVPPRPPATPLAGIGGTNSALPEHFGKHCLHFFFSADISAQCNGLAPSPTDRVDHTLGLTTIRPVIHHDVGSSRPQSEGTRFTNAGVRTGDERLLVFQWFQ
jgi:hypothetical protein